jgi:hypothetical protein
MKLQIESLTNPKIYVGFGELYRFYGEYLDLCNMDIITVYIR